MTDWRDLRALPKAHLHVHLDGAVRATTLAELARERGLAAPEVPRGRAYSDFSAFMSTIQATHVLLQERDALARVTREIVVDNADDGAVWAEVSVWPGMFGDGLGPEAAIEVILDAGRDAAASRDIGFGLMVAANRHEGPRAATLAARIAVAYADRGVVSFGLDGDETINAPDEFADAFAIARGIGLAATPHAGELRGAESVAAALDLLYADRILHGVRAVEDRSLLRRLADSDVCLDVCLTSNVKLSVVPSIAEHPLRELLDANVACTLNADDPLLFDVTLLTEYLRARTDLGLSDVVLAGIATTSVLKSGLRDDAKRSAISSISGWLAD
jgi:adenosine deaminase